MIRFGKILGSAKLFRRNRDGATAIEFTLLALPFFLIVFAIIETSISYTTEQYMSNVAERVAREIRTGQIRAADYNGDQFRTEICDRLQALAAPNCPGMSVDVRFYPTFAAVPRGVTVESGVLNTNGWDFNPGGSSTINSIRIAYEWPVYTDLMRRYFTGLNNGKNLLYASTTWQNEPF